ncbi:MAG TPA: hypothetical protein VNH18_26025 [Bryobacteraceae bacterium]|nr:hypothetical protein [Bryobacteraceae bacterium]
MNPGFKVTRANRQNTIQGGQCEVYVYSVQETDLLVIAKGAASKPFQIALWLAGVAVGALPGACPAISAIVAGRTLETPSVVALSIFVGSIVGSIVGALAYRDTRSLAKLAMKGILGQTGRIHLAE